jgi:hypothetical protein
MVSLHTNPQEDASIGVHHIPMYVPVVGAAGFYLQELVKHPQQFKIDFMANRSPMNNLIPNAKEMMEQSIQKGVGRPTP